MTLTVGKVVKTLKFKEGTKATKTEGQKFTLTADEILGDESKVSITYKELTHDCKPGMTILLDDGLIELYVDEVKENDIAV